MPLLPPVLLKAARVKEKEARERKEERLKAKEEAKEAQARPRRTGEALPLAGRLLSVSVHTEIDAASPMAKPRHQLQERRASGPT